MRNFLRQPSSAARLFAQKLGGKRVKVVTLLAVTSVIAAVAMAPNSSASTPTSAYKLSSLKPSGTSGDKVVVTDDGRVGQPYVVYEANGVGDYVVYSAKVPTAGQYKVQLGIKKFSTRGIFQLAIKGAANSQYDGSFVDHGAVQDAYAPTQEYQIVDIDTMTFGTAGTKQFRFTVTGKNPNSSGYTIGLDKIILTPVTPATTTTTTKPATPTTVKPTTTTAKPTTTTTAKPTSNTTAPTPTSAKPTTTTVKPTTTTTKPSTPGAVAKPSAANTGVPNSTVLTTYTGPSTITVDGTVIDGKAVYVDLRVAAKNVIIRNSYLHCGDEIPASNTGCVDANSDSNFNLLVENNTIIPDHPSYYRDGIVGHEYTARGNEIAHSNDGLGIFNKPGKTASANVVAERNYIHDLTHWNNDPAHNDGTHNDGIEIQGGTNIHIFNNTIIGSVVAGDGLGVFGLHAGSAIILVQNTSAVSNCVIEYNWLDDAQNTVDIDYGKYDHVTVTLAYNKFGRNQYQYARASTYQIRVISQSKSTVNGLYTNTWEDTGVLLADGRDSGIRYNES